MVYYVCLVNRKRVFDSFIRLINPYPTMRNDKNLYENVDNKDQWYIDNYWSSDDETDDKPRRSKAIAIGLIISVAVVLGAIRLWNVFQRP